MRIALDARPLHWPGIGRYAVTAAVRLDYPAILAWAARRLCTQNWGDCIDGPGIPACSGCAETLDLDADGDVDLADFAVYQRSAP